MTTWVRLDGRSPYEAVHRLQEALVERVASGAIGDVVLFLEHPPTITLGRKKEAERSVIAPDGAPVVRVERGGDATWHAPGQLVVYPIVALAEGRRDLHAALRALEDAVIGLLGGLGLTAGRDPRNTGVWIDGHKVCSIGIAVRSWVVWHGLALNVDVELAGFGRIRPCGFDAEVMTRLGDHLDPCPTLDALVPALAEQLASHLHLDPPTTLVHATVLDEAGADALVARLSGEVAAG